MKNKNIFFLLAFATCFNQSYISKSFAHDAEHSAEIDELLELDIEGLMDVEVSVASKKMEKISQAPSVITVVTDEEIRKYGAVSLVDVLRRVPGVFPAGAHDIHDSMFSVRGQHSSSINKHLLVLLNGRPMRDGYAGGINSAIYRGFPLDAIQRLEIIRGPGSVLYGSGAFAGVINIITKTPQKDNNIHGSAYTGYGSFNTKEVGGTISGGNDEISGFLAGRAWGSDGDSDTAFDSAGTQGEISLGSSNHLVTGQLYYNDFTLSVMDAYTREDITSSSARLPMTHRTDRRRHVDAGYVFDIADDWKLHTNLTYDNTNYTLHRYSLIGRSHDLLTEAYIQGQLTDRLGVMVGASYNDLRGSTKPANAGQESKTFRNIWKSVYAQVDAQPFDFMKLTGGLQFNDANGLTNVSPRVGAVVNVDKNWGGKLLYAEAFRSPSGLETSFLVPGVITGNDNLQPELIQTFDAQIFFNNSWLSSSLGYYRSLQRDSVEVVFNPGIGLLQFQNSGKTEFHGVEFESKAKIDENWEIQGSVTVQENETNAGVKDSQLVPNFMAKAGVTYTSDNGITVGVFDNYLGDPARRKNLTPSSTERNPSEGSYHHLTANIEFDIPKLLGRGDLPDMKFSIFGDNLLESDPIYFPDDTEGSINTLPTHSGRAIFGRFTVNF